ncbi:MAG TPA: hypothetical protein VFR90_04455 [Methylibium sp.]|uniref:hypothetical protein n=1 Tax=Methylibium sp. TaxID=2067992 RepID=UPI002DB9A5D7|nr:hypothetical protein [Methylibium sp.]HEU4458353.1 hypothetical protein [Methylibium sp.]
MADVPASRRSIPLRDGLRRFVASLPLLIAAAWLAGAAAAARADGLAAGSGDIARGWQGRVDRSDAGDRASARFGESWSSRSSLSLFGDYYFGRGGLDAPGLSSGFRATGGLFVGPRSGLGLSASGLSALGSSGRAGRGFGLALPAAPAASGDVPDASSVPYVGVGYSGLKALRATGGGWAFSADVGVMALQPRSAVRFGAQPAAEALRELQFSPLLQVGAAYSF